MDMLRNLLKLFLREYRHHGMARFAVWALAYGAALGLTDRGTGGVPGLLWIIFWASVVAAGFYYLSRLVNFVKQRLLWRLRSRLMVTYLFIAVAPVLLIVLLVSLGAFIINGQFAAFLVTSRLRNHFDELQQLNRAVVLEARRSASGTPEAALDRLQAFYVTELSPYAESYPGLEITLRVGARERVFRLDGLPTAKPVNVPAWLAGAEFTDFVTDGHQVLLRALTRARTGSGDLVVILSEPFTPELLDLVGQGIGPVGVVSPLGGEREPQSPHAQMNSGEPAQTEPNLPRRNLSSKSLQLPSPASLLDVTVFGASALNPVLWDGEREQRLTEPVFILVNSRVFALNRQLFVTLGRISSVYLSLFIAVAIIFLLIEIFALVNGVELTRSMTTTVDRLHGATERVKAGDLSCRINLPARDQLSSLGEAFDAMTASVERLLRESQEKLRLESELEIAREIQRQLFPRGAPEVSGLRLCGVSKPARTVSGDFYDFLRLGENRVGLVLGDVSGKGISAALLMAAIQSALRAQFFGVSPRKVGDGTPAPAEVLERLNRQLYDSTPSEKYVTLFYSVYDGATRKLTYSNAGHPPPVLFRHGPAWSGAGRGSVERLKTGGTVVGMFPEINYEQVEVELAPGDFLLAFTDGMTEPENSFGEEFGEARLLEAVRRASSLSPEDIVREIYRSVDDWTGSPELQDDMTLVVAEAVA